MSSLIILGNTNRFTFTNCIIAANSASLQEFAKPLTNIFVIHSSQSQEKLCQYLDWQDHLEKHHISRELLIQKVIDIDFTNQSIERFVEFIEFIVNGVLVSNPNLIVDLTNGTTVHKNLLSTVAYILGLGQQYIMDFAKIQEAVKALKIEKLEYLPLDILQASYIPVPEATRLDSIALLNLTEILRYKQIIAEHGNNYEQIDEFGADKNFFVGNLSHSIQLKLRADRERKEDRKGKADDEIYRNAIYRIAASSIAASIEEVISTLIARFALKNRNKKGELTEPRMLGEKLSAIELAIKEKNLADFDADFLHELNSFVKYLRNSSTHKSRQKIEIERFRADISTLLTFPFVDYYLNAVYPILKDGKVDGPLIKIHRIPFVEIKPEDCFYFGLDGDNTGLALEELFLSANDEIKFQEMSHAVEQAVSESTQFIEKNFLDGKIIFAAGDDIFFKGGFNQIALQELQRIYKNTAGMTCSIGFGRSFQEVYLALKLAKTEPGKNSIVGVEIG